MREVSLEPVQTRRPSDSNVDCFRGPRSITHFPRPTSFLNQELDRSSKSQKYRTGTRKKLSKCLFRYLTSFLRKLLFPTKRPQKRNSARKSRIYPRQYRFHPKPVSYSESAPKTEWTRVKYSHFFLKSTSNFLISNRKTRMIPVKLQRLLETRWPIQQFKAVLSRSKQRFPLAMGSNIDRVDHFSFDLMYFSLFSTILPITRVTFSLAFESFRLRRCSPFDRVEHFSVLLSHSFIILDNCSAEWRWYDC